MGFVTITAERTIAAPADVVYHCIADYNEHHRPEGFLPSQFSDFRVEQGGVGAGTVISFSMTVGGRTRRVTQSVTEPDPGRVLVEAGDGGSTTFTVEPTGDRCRTQFETGSRRVGLADCLHGCLRRGC